MNEKWHSCVNNQVAGDGCISIARGSCMLTPTTTLGQDSRICKRGFKSGNHIRFVLRVTDIAQFGLHYRTESRAAC
jgi:hypothetical protein